MVNISSDNHFPHKEQLNVKLLGEYYIAWVNPWHKRVILFLGCILDTQVIGLLFIEMVSSDRWLVYLFGLKIMENLIKKYLKVDLSWSFNFCSSIWGKFAFDLNQYW